MREIVDGDPRYIVGILDAAADLECAAGGVARREGETLENIAKLRAAAFGFREAETLFQLPYKNRKPVDARHDAALSAKHAKEADQKADKLSKEVHLPFEMQGHSESLAQMFWTAYRNVHVEVESQNITWLLILLAVIEDAFVSNRARRATHGGTAERIAAWNAPIDADIAKDQCTREEIFERLAQSSAADKHYERDTELMHHAHKAAWAFGALLTSYGVARAKAMQN
ncbi:MAG: hypothetical protein KGJ49_12990 [Alphaproteobacteria bacterium]|nr:hypothetical protein [Alphaproteobacteria bacterium]